ncbi:Carbon-nitrogen hydrolase [Candidatus Rhodobacter oscarellae]|uniref:Carbon-nitrogen hydrolase n=1 Tax=Candidatus Rhodobacter oscarellae TaxID=1675527 RepID=A0A0J9E813_9RHOB|nr:carbon-nitrogen hydrolase family protein [Candidatus Rhodobacter lobularis]KMW58867.1 Carbon-nitrogen hydrolase [Candidatus Rhodobacter lobularis]
MTRAALIQLSSSDDPAANLVKTREYVSNAAQIADLIVTPEVTNCVSTSRTRQIEVLRPEAEDPTLAALRDDAARLGKWVLIGSLALKTDDPQGRFANRSFLINPAGDIAARYDKIHMFDVTISDTEQYHESKGYRPGDQITVVDTPLGKIGLTICYDMRFPALYRALGQAGAQIITVPSAFSPVTGAAHWEVLLRSRAIETGAYILAPAQTGQHALTRGRPRATFGHSVAIDPWGGIEAKAGAAPGVTLVALDLAQVTLARTRIPALSHDRPFSGP